MPGDHIIIWDEKHLAQIIKEYVAYSNQMHPHQGIGQNIPDPPPEAEAIGAVPAQPVLGGLHHLNYRKAA